MKSVAASHKRFGVCVLMLILSGCANDSYRYVAEVGQRGTVHIIEHGQRKQFERARVRFTSGMDGVLARVPHPDGPRA